MEKGNAKKKKRNKTIPQNVVKNDTKRKADNNNRTINNKKQKNKVDSKIVENNKNGVNARNTENKKETKIKIDRKTIIIILSICLLIVILFLLKSSYAIYKANVDVDGNYSFQVGTLDFEIQNESNSIKLLNAYPMSDDEGLSLTPYKFSIKNTGTMDANYVISLQDDEALKDACLNCEFLEKDRLKIELRENDVTILGPVLLSEIDKLKIGNLKAGAINNYELRLWLDYNNTTTLDMGKYYYGRINVALYQETLVMGSVININDAKDAQINSIAITGNQVDGKTIGSDGSFDLVITGKNLIKKSGYSTPKSDTDFWWAVGDDSVATTMDNGYMDISLFNTSSTTQYANLMLKKEALACIIPDTKYTYFYEVTDLGSTDKVGFMIASSDPGGKDYFIHQSGESDWSGTYLHRVISNGKYVLPLTTRSDFSNVIRGLRTYFDARAGKTVYLRIRAMLLYGDVALSDVGEYEDYKERRYTINLKDKLNNVIDGIKSGEKLENVNGVYGIVKNDGSFIELSDDTQNVLKSIKTFNGVNNIFIDGDILPSNIEISY